MTTKDDRTEGGVSAFAANLIGLFEAVGQCLQQQLVLPTLALIYTGIDVVESIDRGANTLGLEFTDNMSVTEQTYLSFYELGRMPRQRR